MTPPRDEVLRRGGGHSGRWIGPGEPATAMLVAAVVAVGVWQRGGLPTAVVCCVAAAAIRRRVVVLLPLLCVVAAVRGDAAVRSLEPDRLGPYTGWATVALDPAPGRGVTRVVLQVEGERYEAWVRGRAGQLRVARWQQGDRVWASGVRQPLPDERAGRVAWQHVVGEFDRTYFGDRTDGRPLAVAANRVRDVVARGTGVLGMPRAALARGLIIGDDREQPHDMTDRFRASGLSHVTAVSGQNVSYLLAAAGPLLRRLRPVPRLVATVALIGWFVVLTRAEPSILRAGAMAAIAAVAYAFGREREPPRLLALAVAGLLLVDPLLVRSVGFWLSVGATAGVTVLTGPLSRTLAPLGRAAMPLAVTVAAQAGVALPSLLVFGRLSVIGTIANLVAVPVAGFVMLYGLPAALAAGAVPPLATVVMAPVDLGVRWVDGVALLAARADPPAGLNAAGWLVVTAGVACGAAASRLRQ